MVGVNAFAAAFVLEFGADGEGAGFEAFDCVAVCLGEVEGGGVAAGEVVECGSAVFAAGGDGDADAGDFGVDFEAGFAADGDAGGVGGAVGDGGGGSSVGGVVIRPTLALVGCLGAVGGAVGSSDRNLWGLLRFAVSGSESTRVVDYFARRSRHALEP